MAVGRALTSHIHARKVRGAHARGEHALWAVISDVPVGPGLSALELVQRAHPVALAAVGAVVEHEGWPREVSLTPGALVDAAQVWRLQ